MSDLLTFLEDAFAEAGGELPFDRFMELALYAPGFGYYSTHIGGVGRRGDFSTSATLTAGLGNAIRNWIREESDHFEWKMPIPLIEIGAGGGDLAREILKRTTLFLKQPFRYHIVEVSEPLQKQQREKLARFGGQVSWHSSVEEALESTDGKAHLFSNELIDAFPAKWMRWNDEMKTWEEIHLRFEREIGIRETFHKINSEKEYPEFSSFLPNPVAGQRIEIQPSVRDWLQKWAPHWKQGSLLTIDYGGVPETIYHRRPHGTMRGYFKHERLEGGAIYQRFGKQDLTVDVNFDDLRQWGEAIGWNTICQEKQAIFMENFGVSHDLMANSEAGETFQVLHQRKL